MSVEVEQRVTPEQYIEKRDSQNLGEFGIAQRPVAPQSLRDKNGKVIAQSVGDNTDTVEHVAGAPYPTEKMKQMASEGSYTDSKKWWAAEWLRAIKMFFAKNK